jgi:quercetin dioxygenase-like cupin family protein
VLDQEDGVKFSIGRSLYLVPMVAAMASVVGAQVVAAASVSGDGALSRSAVFAVDQMQARKMANGGEMREIVHGVLATGEAVALHESEYPAGAVPSPLHTIQHSEIVVVLEGTVEFSHDNKEDRVGPGGVIYVAFGTLHRMKNVGNGSAKYVVVALGGDVKK